VTIKCFSQFRAPRLSPTEDCLDFVERHQAQMLGLRQGTAQLFETQHLGNVQQCSARRSDRETLVPDPPEAAGSVHAHVLNGPSAVRPAHVQPAQLRLNEPHPCGSRDSE
jgi:hypothetical protein